MQKGVIFDFNGTLIWDSEYHEEAWRKYASKLLDHKISNDEFDNNVHGRFNKDIFTYLMKRNLSPEELAFHTKKKEQLYRNLCLQNKDKYKLIPGAKKYLDYLKTQKIPFTIATASEITNLNFFIEYFDLKRWFDIDKIVYDDGKLALKPSPDIYIKAAKLINIDPTNCTVFEDAKSGILAAHSAKIGEIILISRDQRNHDLKNMVSMSIKDFNDHRLYTQ